MRTRKSKSVFNKSDWTIILIYFVIVFIMGFVEVDKIDYFNNFLETLNNIFFTFLPILIIMKYVFPATIEQGKIVKFFLYTLIILPFIGYAEMWVVKLIYDENWNMLSPKVYYYGLLSQSENIGVLLALLISKKFFETKLNLTTMEKEMKTNEVRMLNSQIDPHFLFNNLNTVDTLIDTNPIEAKKYLNELSKLYRYLITNKDEEVVQLSEEVKFIDHYIYLIKTRFGHAFQFEINLSPQTQEHVLIPPGAIQGLLENAVKHNMGTPDKPVVTKVYNDQHYLYVTNNISERKPKLESTGNGLQNINARYKLLIEKEIIIISNETYTVKLPLIKELN